MENPKSAFFLLLWKQLTLYLAVDWCGEGLDIGAVPRYDPTWLHGYMANLIVPRWLAPTSQLTGGSWVGKTNIIPVLV